MGEDRLLVAGLGNPGRRYAGTRHNAGHMVLDALARRAGGKYKAHKGGAEILECRISGKQAVLVKPRAYMNVSGPPVAAVRDFFKVSMERVVVIHDDLDLPFGTIRLKHGGGMGGHNGLRSVTSALGGSNYLRVRFGIGRPSGRTDPVSYVLAGFTTGERADLGVHVERAADAVEAIGRDGLAVAQNTYHTQ